MTWNEVARIDDLKYMSAIQAADFAWVVSGWQALACINQADYSVRWRFQKRSQTMGAQQLFVCNRTYVLTVSTYGQTTEMICLDMDEGTERWRRPLNWPLYENYGGLHILQDQALWIERSADKTPQLVLVNLEDGSVAQTVAALSVARCGAQSRQGPVTSLLWGDYLYCCHQTLGLYRVSIADVHALAAAQADGVDVDVLAAAAHFVPLLTDACYGALCLVGDSLFALDVTNNQIVRLAFDGQIDAAWTLPAEIRPLRSIIGHVERRGHFIAVATNHYQVAYLDFAQKRVVWHFEQPDWTFKQVDVAPNECLVLYDRRGHDGMELLKIVLETGELVAVTLPDKQVRSLQVQADAVYLSSKTCSLFMALSAEIASSTIDNDATAQDIALIKLAARFRTCLTTRHWGESADQAQREAFRAAYADYTARYGQVTAAQLAERASGPDYSFASALRDMADLFGSFLFEPDWVAVPALSGAYRFDLSSAVALVQNDVLYDQDDPNAPNLDDIGEVLNLMLHSEEMTVQAAAVSALRGYLGCLPLATWTDEDERAIRLLPNRPLADCPVVKLSSFSVGGVTLASKLSHFVAAQMAHARIGLGRGRHRLTDAFKTDIFYLNALVDGDMDALRNVLVVLDSLNSREQVTDDGVLLMAVDPNDPLYTAFVNIDQKRRHALGEWATEAMQETDEPVDILLRTYIAYHAVYKTDVDLTDAVWRLIERDMVFDQGLSIAFGSRSADGGGKGPLSRGAKWLVAQAPTDIPISPMLWDGIQQLAAEPSAYDGSQHLAHARAIASAQPEQAYRHACNAAVQWVRATDTVPVAAITFAHELATANQWHDIEQTLNWALKAYDILQMDELEEINELAAEELYEVNLLTDNTDAGAE